jgi:hypothetical protein
MKEIAISVFKAKCLGILEEVSQVAEAHSGYPPR